MLWIFSYECCKTFLNRYDIILSDIEEKISLLFSWYIKYFASEVNYYVSGQQQVLSILPDSKYWSNKLSRFVIIYKL